MHICLVSTFPPAPCGIATYSSYLINGLLADARARITVLTPSPVADDLRPQVQVIGAFSEDSDYAAAILQHVRVLAPEVVHIQHEYGIFGFDDRFLHLLIGLRENSVPVVLTLHTVHTRFSLDVGCSWRRDRRLPANVEIEKYQQQLCKLCDVVVVHQDHTMRTALIEQGAPTDRIAFLPHGTFPETGISGPAARKRLGFGHDSPLLVAFGYFEPSKNHQCLLEAFSLLRLRQHNAKLWIGGHVRWPSPPAAEYQAHIMNLIDKMGLQEHVTMCKEEVPESDVSLLLAAADMSAASCIGIEDTYSSSGALHRMLGSGRPIVASDIPKFHELRQILPEILVNPDNPEELARVLIRLLEDCSFRALIASKARQFAAETSWPRVAKSHLDIYRRAITAARGPSLGRSQYALASSG